MDFIGSTGLKSAWYLRTAARMECAALTWMPSLNSRKLAHRPDIAFLMVGDGGKWKRLQARRDELRLTRVITLDQQPKQMLPRIWSVCDASLVPRGKTELCT